MKRFTSSIFLTSMVLLSRASAADSSPLPVNTPEVLVAHKSTYELTSRLVSNFLCKDADVACLRKDNNARSIVSPRLNEGAVCVLFDDENKESIVIIGTEDSTSYSLTRLIFGKKGVDEYQLPITALNASNIVCDLGQYRPRKIFRNDAGIMYLIAERDAKKSADHESFAGRIFASADNGVKWRLIVDDFSTKHIIDHKINCHGMDNNTLILSGYQINSGPGNFEIDDRLVNKNRISYERYSAFKDGASLEHSFNVQEIENTNEEYKIDKFKDKVLLHGASAKVDSANAVTFVSRMYPIKPSTYKSVNDGRMAVAIIKQEASLENNDETTNNITIEVVLNDSDSLKEKTVKLELPNRNISSIGSFRMSYRYGEDAAFRKNVEYLAPDKEQKCKVNVQVSFHKKFWEDYPNSSETLKGFVSESGKCIQRKGKNCILMSYNTPCKNAEKIVITDEITHRAIMNELYNVPLINAKEEL